MKKTLFPMLALLITLTLGLTTVASSRLHGGFIDQITYSPDGNRIAMANKIGIWIYDAHTGTELNRLIGKTGRVLSITYSPDGATIASGDTNGTIRLWDAGAGQHKATLKGHTSSIWSIAYSPDGSTIVTGGYDGTVRVWDANTGKHKSTFRHQPAVWTVFPQ